MGRNRTDSTAVSTANARADDEPAAVWVERTSLKPWTQNPRKNDAAVQKVADAIKRFGWGAPIVARKADGEVIAGHTRLKAAEVLGLKQVPVRFVDLDPTDAHLLALADNKIGEVAEWDAPMLADVLGGFGLEDAELAGWDSTELEKLADQVEDFGPLDASPGLDGVAYSVTVACDSEAHQADLIAKLEAEGYRCKPVML